MSQYDKTNPSANSNDREQSDYFDLHTSGIGYASRLRKVEAATGRRFEPFWAVSVAALRGRRDDPEYTYYDLKIVNQEVLRVLQRNVRPINSRDSKVLMGFRFGDEYPEIYYVADDETGEQIPRVSLKARLINLDFIKIKHGEGQYQLVYRRPRDDHDGQAEEQGGMPENGGAPSQPEEPGQAAEVSAESSGLSTVDEVIDAIEEGARTITLFRAAPGYEQAKEVLEQAGYRYREVFGDQTNVWVNPALVKVEQIQALIDDGTALIHLTKGDPEFDECYALLKGAEPGYAFRREFDGHENVWVRRDLLKEQPADLAA